MLDFGFIPSIKRHIAPVFIELLAILLIANSLVYAHAGVDWPQPALPERVNVFPIGDQLTANGLPMRVQGFVSPSDNVADLLTWFRSHWGQPLMENTLGNKRILGRLHNGFYWTVQIEPVGQGIKGLVAVTAFSEQGRDRNAAFQERLLARWPVGSQLVSHVVSPLAGKSASHVVISSSHSDSLNRDAVKTMLADDGMALEREIPAQNRSHQTLFFKGEGKDAIAMISRGASGRTVVVLNTVTTLEAFKK
jgi:hypothetical protein